MRVASKSFPVLIGFYQAFIQISGPFRKFLGRTLNKQNSQQTINIHSSNCISHEGKLRTRFTRDLQKDLDEIKVALPKK